ncbi:MAG: hypothetical protein WBD47_15380 [Phormidesmis sp.]
MKAPVKRLFLLMVTFALTISLGLTSQGITSRSTSQSAQAQPAPLRRINPTALAAQVHEQLPDLPLENQYIARETGAAAAEDTLVSRIIRYHIYTKARSTVFRLDWKLTLADYLGAFERMSADDYPDYGLTENPMTGDVAVIQSLDPALRDRLVNTLYETFTTSAESPAEQSTRPTR